MSSCNKLTMYGENPYDELDLIAELSDNYDGEGSSRVPDNVMDKARYVLDSTEEYICHILDISPMPYGTICIDWLIGYRFISADIDSEKMNFYNSGPGDTRYMDTIPISEGLGRLKEELYIASSQGQ